MTVPKTLWGCTGYSGVRWSASILTEVSMTKRVQPRKRCFWRPNPREFGKYKLASAYRSIEYQDKLWQARIAKDPDYGSDPYKSPVKVVPERCSEHTTGLAIDILSECYENSDEGYADTPEGIWLYENAYKFGFILRYPKDKENITGVIFEPWHYRYVGKEAAGEIYSRGICLEEYLGSPRRTIKGNSSR